MSNAKKRPDFLRAQIKAQNCVSWAPLGPAPIPGAREVEAADWLRLSHVSHLWGQGLEAASPRSPPTVESGGFVKVLVCSGS